MFKMDPLMQVTLYLFNAASPTIRLKTLDIVSENVVIMINSGITQIKQTLICWPNFSV